MDDFLRLIVDENPQLRQQQRRKEWWASLGISPVAAGDEQESLIHDLEFGIEGLASPQDARRLQTRLGRIKGVCSVVVDFLAAHIRVGVVTEVVDIEQLLFVVSDAGFSAWPLLPDSDATGDAYGIDRWAEHRQSAIRTGISALIVVTATLIFQTFSVASSWLQHVVLDVSFYLAMVVLWLGRGLVLEMWDALAERRLNSTVLWAFSAVIVYLVAIWEFFAQQDPSFNAGVLIVAGWHLHRALQSRADMLTQKLRYQLETIKPSTVTVLRDGSKYQVRLDRVQPGDLILVAESEVIPSDGCLVRGAAVIDESALLGHSHQRDVSEGSWVLGGTLCDSGNFLLEPQCVFDASYYGQMLNLLTASRTSMSPFQERMQWVGRHLVTASLILAALTFCIVWVAYSNSLADAALLSIAVLLSLNPWVFEDAARNAFEEVLVQVAGKGVLVRDNALMEAIINIRHGLLMREGVVSDPIPKVVSLDSGGHVSEGALAEIFGVMLLEISRPLNEGFRDFALNTLGISEYQEMPLIEGFQRRGLLSGTGRINGHSVLIGSRAVLHELGVILPDSAASSSTQFELYAVRDDIVVGQLLFEYELDPSVMDASNRLEELGLKLTMASLDRTSESPSEQMVIGHPTFHRTALQSSPVSIAVLERGRPFVAWPSVTLLAPVLPGMLELKQQASRLARRLTVIRFVAFGGLCAAPFAISGFLPIGAAVLWAVLVPVLARKIAL